MKNKSTSMMKLGEVVDAVRIEATIAHLIDKQSHVWPNLVVTKNGKSLKPVILAMLASGMC